MEFDFPITWAICSSSTHILLSWGAFCTPNSCHVTEHNNGVHLHERGHIKRCDISTTRRWCFKGNGCARYDGQVCLRIASSLNCPLFMRERQIKSISKSIFSTKGLLFNYQIIFLSPWYAQYVCLNKTYNVTTMSCWHVNKICYSRPCSHLQDA